MRCERCGDVCIPTLFDGAFLCNECAKLVQSSERHRARRDRIKQLIAQIDGQNALSNTLLHALRNGGSKKQ